MNVGRWTGRGEAIRREETVLETQSRRVDDDNDIDGDGAEIACSVGGLV